MFPACISLSRLDSQPPCLLQLEKERTRVEQLRGDAAAERARSAEETERLRAGVATLRDDLTRSRRDLQDAQTLNAQCKTEIQVATDELDRAKRVQDDQAAEVSTPVLLCGRSRPFSLQFENLVHHACCQW